MLLLTIVNYRISNPELQWNWDKIKTDKIYFPNDFMWGTATAAHQVEGNNTNNNWYRFEHQKDSNGKPRIHNNDKSGLAADHWNRYNQDIGLMNKLGVKYYRFSVEWSKIEPKNGIFNEKALEHYRELCTTLIDSGLIPVVTLHHFTHPIWFEDLGGFEKEENIEHYLEFSEIVFNKLSDLVPYWCTINEIGLVKNITQFDPLRRWHILDWYFSRILNDIFTNNTIDLLTTGNFNFYLPGMANISYKNTDAIGAIDFIGLNYYSRWHVKGHLNTATPFTFETRPEDIQTDMPYSIYPEGFYRAIQTISKLNKPIIITENGIADNKDDRRKLFIERYLYALYKALMDGYDIRGYFYWTLMDNFEWAEGYMMKFGLYEVDFTTQKRELRKGSLAFSKIVKQPGADKRGYIVSIGDQAPDLLLEYTNGKTVQLSDLIGQVVVLQFTASWCSVCIQEMPHLEKEVWNAYKDKGLMLIGIDRDEPLDVVEKFQEKVGTTYPIALDPGAKHFSKFAHINSGVTRNIVIDKNGKIAFLTRLFDKEEFQAMINKIDLLIQE